MIKNAVSTVLCATFLLASVPVMAASSKMPQGKRDAMSMKITKHRFKTHQKRNKEADRNVDRLIDNRK